MNKKIDIKVGDFFFLRNRALRGSTLLCRVVEFDGDSITWWNPYDSSDCSLRLSEAEMYGHDIVVLTPEQIKAL